MSITRNLQGVGTGAAQARAIVGVMDRNKTATGTTRADAYLLSEDVTIFTVVPANTGAALRSDSQENDVYTVVNNGANALKVYPPVGGNIDGAGVNVAYSLSAGTFADFQALGDNIFIVRQPALAPLAASTGAGLVGAIYAGVGAVATTVLAWLRREVWADGYDTLQHALDTGKKVRLTDGVTYPITSQVTIPSGGGIVGNGIITFSSANFTNTATGTISALSVPIYALNVSDITLRDFKMVGTCGVNSHLYPIALRNVSKSKVIGLDISGLNSGSMIKIDSCSDIEIKYNNFHDSTLDRNIGSGQLTAVETDNDRISGVGSKRLDISFNWMVNLSWTPAFLAAYGPQSDGVNMQIGTTNSVVFGNIMDTVGEGVDCFGEDNNIAENTIANVLGFGVKLIHGASRNKVHANRIINSGLGGINVAGSSSASQNTDRNYITDNLISGAGTNPGGYWVQPMYGIGFNNDGTYKPTNTIARGNRVVSSPGATAAFQGATAGTGNVYDQNYSDGTAASEFTGSGFTAYVPGYVGDSTGLARIYGAAPILRIEETDAAADEKIYDTVYVAGDMSRRTRTDANGAGEVLELVQRTGTNVDLIRWHADVMQFGGVDTQSRYAQFNNWGVLVQAFNDNSIAQMQELRNWGITGSNQGVERVATFGAGGVLGGTGFRERILSTEDWSVAANRSTQVTWELVQDGSIVNVATWSANGVAIRGTNTNNSAAAGYIGEFVTATVVAGSAVSLTTATTANVTSISLTAGDWDVSAQNNFVLTGSTSTQHTTGISLTSATLPIQAGGSGLGTDPLALTPIPTTTLSGTLSQSVPPVRVSLAATTTVYLVAQATFSAGTETVYGTIRARRKR